MNATKRHERNKLQGSCFSLADELYLKLTLYRTILSELEERRLLRILLTTTSTALLNSMLLDHAINTSPHRPRHITNATAYKPQQYPC